MRRQPFQQRAPQRRAVHRAGDIRHGASVPHGHRGVLHGPVALQLGFHLVKQNALAGDLHLPVSPPGEGDRAVRQEPGPVPGVVQRPAIRPGTEGPGGQLRLVQVAERHAVSAGAQLALPARGNRLPFQVQDGDGGAANRTADGHRRVRGVVTRDAVAAGEGGVLGRAVAVDQRGAGQGGQRLGHVRRGQHVPAREQLPHRRQRGQALLHHGVEQPAGEPRDGYAVAGDGVRDRVQRGHRVRHDRQRGAVQQGAPNLEGRGVKPERGGMQHHVRRREADVIRPDHQPLDPAAGRHHALRPPGGAGGVHDIGRRLAILARGWKGGRVGQGLIQPQDWARGGNRTVRDQDGRRRVGQHGVPRRLRQRRVQRDIGGPGFPHRQHGRNGVGAAVQQQRRPAARPQPRLPQCPRNCVCTSVQAGVTDRPVASHSNRVRLSERYGPKSLVQERFLTDCAARRP